MNESETSLERSFDEVLNQLSKWNTIEGLKQGRRWIELEKIKEWKSKFRFQFHI